MLLERRETYMTDEQQKKVFAENLNYYMELNHKQQVDVAKDLGINATTLNMWCKGNSMPGTGKLRRLSDYFHIGMSSLTDIRNTDDEDARYSDAIANISMNDKRFCNVIITYNELPADKKEVFCEFFEKFIM